MAAAIMRLKAGDNVEIHTAGTNPKSEIDQLSAKVIAEIGADMTGEVVKPVDPSLLDKVDRVVVLSAAAVVDPQLVPPGNLERWGIDEPLERGIDGVERMRLIRDDIELHVNQLVTDLELDRVI